MDVSKINFLELTFIGIGLLTFLPGLVVNYAQKCLPEAFLQLFRYGRANVPSSSGQRIGIIRKFEVPKRWFYHVYIYAILLQSFILYTVVSTYKLGSQGTWLKTVLGYAGGSARLQTVNASTTVLAVSLFLMQVTRRLYENLFVCVYSDTKMNVVHYLLTWIHYTGSMLSIVAHSEFFANPEFSDGHLCWTRISIFGWIATIIFLYGSWVQYQSHAILASLRKDKGDNVVTLKHQIPRGGLFEKVSCPNYWGEILVYSSLALLFRFQNYTWNYVAMWVLANQVITGIVNHKWYLATFPKYPKDRKAVIPYVW